MVIDVSGLEKGESREVVFDETVNIPKNYVDNSLIPVKITGTIEKDSDGKFCFTGNVEAWLVLKCDLCLKPFDYKLSTTMNEIFCTNEDEQKDIWLFSDNKIELEPAVVSSILLSLPMRAVCSDDCKGFCHVCGKNLNEGLCGCNVSNNNPLFEELKTLFDDEEV